MITAILCLVYVETRSLGRMEVEVFEFASKTEAQDFAEGAPFAFKHVTNTFINCEETK